MKFKYLILFFFLVTWKIKVAKDKSFWSTSFKTFETPTEAVTFIDNLFTNPDIIEVKIKVINEKS